MNTIRREFPRSVVACFAAVAMMFAGVTESTAQDVGVGVKFRSLIPASRTNEGKPQSPGEDDLDLRIVSALLPKGQQIPTDLRFHLAAVSVTSSEDEASRAAHYTALPIYPDMTKMVEAKFDLKRPLTPASSAAARPGQETVAVLRDACRKLRVVTRRSASTNAHAPCSRTGGLGCHRRMGDGADGNGFNRGRSGASALVDGWWRRIVGHQAPKGERWLGTRVPLYLLVRCDIRDIFRSEYARCAALPGKGHGKTTRDTTQASCRRYRFSKEKSVAVFRERSTCQRATKG